MPGSGLFRLKTRMSYESCCSVAWISRCGLGKPYSGALMVEHQYCSISTVRLVKINLNPAVAQTLKRQKTNSRAGFDHFPVAAEQFQIGEPLAVEKSFADNDFAKFWCFNSRI